MLEIILSYSHALKHEDENIFKIPRRSEEKNRNYENPLAVMNQSPHTPATLCI